MIVKVQLSITTNAPVQQAIIYDRNQRNYWSGDAPPELVAKMEGKPKLFFHAEIKNEKFVLLNKAPWQRW